VVTNSRPTCGGVEIWRRRKCLRCKEKITTHEKIDLSYIVVIKRSGKRVKFARAKLYSGIYQAVAETKNLDRGTAGEMAESVLKDIEKRIIDLKTKELETTKILTITSQVLKNTYFDSYLRYIAYFGKNEGLKKMFS